MITCRVQGLLLRQGLGDGDGVIRCFLGAGVKTKVSRLFSFFFKYLFSPKITTRQTTTQTMNVARKGFVCTKSVIFDIIETDAVFVVFVTVGTVGTFVTFVTVVTVVGATGNVIRTPSDTFPMFP